VADLLVAGVEHDVGRLAERTAPPGLELLVELGRGPRDLGRGHVEPAELLGHFDDLPGRDPLEVHLGDRELQRPFAPEPSFEALGIERDGLPTGHRSDLRSL